MLKSRLLQCNPTTACLAYTRHGGHVISFLFTPFNPLQTSDWSLCAPLTSFQRGTVSQPPPATPAKALLMSHAEGRLHITSSPVSRFVQCGGCLFHDISDSWLACDPLVLRDLLFFLVFLLQSCCSSLHAPAADCSRVASKPCTSRFLRKSSSTVCSTFTVQILSPAMPAVPPVQGCVEIQKAGSINHPSY